MGLILIADGGSTKVHWQLRRPDGTVADEFITAGVNPAVMAENEVERLMGAPLRSALDPHPPVSEVRYYGAGCKGEWCAVMERVIRRTVGDIPVTVGSDMLGTCIGLLGNRPGIACILGTGANSCLFDGHSIVANTPPLGFILGDEGSGTWLGKRLVSDRFKELLPRHLAEAFDSAFSLTEAETVRRVYRPSADDESPNRFLASLVPFIASNITHPYMQKLVTEGFHSFLSRNVMRYFSPELLTTCGITDSHTLPVSFSGGVAYAFREQLRQALIDFRLTPGVIVRSPLG